MANPTQKLAVALAFIVAVLSLAAAALAYARTGTIRLTPLVGGALMLALALSGYRRLKSRRA